MKRLHHYARYLWYTLAGLTLLLAVAVSLARALLPYLEDYRTALESEVSRYIGQPVTIEQLDARLLGLSPSIIFRHVVLKSSQQGAPIARFDEIRIGLDLFATLRQRRPVLRELMVSGANIVVVRHEDGTLSVEGLVATAPEQSAANGTSNLGGWLLTQGRLAVRDSTLLWRDELKKRQLRFDHVALELLNSGERHRLNGFVDLPEGTGKSLKVAVDLHGNPLAGPQWNGHFYLKADEVHPLDWLRLVNTGLPELPLKSGAVSCELWSEWQQGLPVRSEGSFLLKDATLKTPQSSALTVRRLAGELLWRQQESGWVLDLQQVELQLGKEKLPPSRFHIEHRNSGDLLLADRLDVGDISAVVQRLPLLPTAPQELLGHLAPRGEVHKLRLERRADGALDSQGEFVRLGLDAWERVPGFDGMSGHWRSDKRGGEVSLDSHQAAFDAPRLFRAPLKIEQLNGQLLLRPLDDGWLLEGQNIAVSNQDISASGRFDMQFETGRKPYLDLGFDFWNGVARRVPHYVPAKIMGEHVVTWLDNAFANGRARSGTLLFHGRTSDFPFADQQGFFETRFEAESVDLAFQKGWPLLNNISGEVLFQNDSLMITPRSGKLYDTEIESAQVSIANLHQAVLEMDIKAAPPASDVLRLLTETPLSQHLGGALDGMEADGKSTLDLLLRLPLSAQVAEQTPLHYEGDIALRDSRLQVWKGVVFRKLNGTVRFSENSFESSGLSGELFGAPVTIGLHTDEMRRTVVTGKGRITAVALRRELSLPFIEYLDGESDWRGLLYLPRGEGTHPSMEFTSKLQGMALNLPAPVGKKQDESVPLSVRVAFGADSAKRLNIAYGERLSARLGFVGKAAEMRRAALRFGPGGVELPKEEQWRISGSLQGLDWNRWHELLPAGAGSAAGLPLVIDMDRLVLLSAPESGPVTTTVKPEAFPSLDLHVRELTYDQWHLGDVTGSSRSGENFWDVPAVHMVGPDHDIHLSAHWRAGESSHFEFSATSGNVEGMLHSFGVASVLARSTGTISGNLAWPGPLSDPSWATISGKLAVDLKDGGLVDVNPGAGRLFGLLSLQALPRRLTLDFRDLFQKGLQFDEIKGDIRVSGGSAYTDNLYIKSPSAGILVEGRTGLVKRDYDQTISVVPNVSDSVSIASAIAWGPQVAAAVLLFQNIFKKDIAKATMIRYSVTGGWDDPKITRINAPAATTAKQ